MEGRKEGRKKKAVGGNQRVGGKVKGGEESAEERRWGFVEPEETEHPGTVCCQKQMMVVLEVAGDEQLKDQVVPQNW